MYDKFESAVLFGQPEECYHVYTVSRSLGRLRHEVTPISFGVFRRLPLEQESACGIFR